jgi:hypothetical protein
LIAKADYAHRGVFQAQGGRGKSLQESEPWFEHKPLLASAGRALLEKLRNKLSASDRDARESGFAAAHVFINVCEDASGVYAVFKKSFPQKPNRFGVRVDIEVGRGCAFVPPR